MQVPEHPMPARDKVCYVGQPVAVVVAQDRYIAKDALDLLRVEYDPLPPLVDPVAAAQDSATPLHATFGTNVAMRICVGRGDLQAAFAQADCIARANATMCPGLPQHPMECRALVAHYEPAEQRLTLWASTQTPHKVKRYVGLLLQQPPREVRVIAPDVGGGFGQKVEIWPEDIALSYLAMRLAQPIKWVEEHGGKICSPTMVAAIVPRWKPPPGVMAPSSVCVSASLLTWGRVS